MKDRVLGIIILIFSIIIMIFFKFLVGSKFGYVKILTCSDSWSRTTSEKGNLSAPDFGIYRQNHLVEDLRTQHFLPQYFLDRVFN